MYKFTTYASTSALEQIYTAPSGNIYVVYVQSGSRYLRVYKSSNSGSTFSLTASLDAYSVFSDASLPSFAQVHMTGDGNGLYLIGHTDSAYATYTNFYCKYTFSTDTFGTVEHPFNNENADYAITVDSDGVPHAVTALSVTNMGKTYYQVMYANRSGGSWSTEAQISTNNADHGYLRIQANGTVIEVMATGGGTGTWYRTRTGGSWGSEGDLTAAAYPWAFIRTSGSVIERWTRVSYSSGSGYRNNTLVSPDSPGYPILMSSGSYYLAYSKSDGIYTRRWLGSTSWDSEVLGESLTNTHGCSPDMVYPRYDTSGINFAVLDNNSGTYYCYYGRAGTLPKANTSKAAYTKGQSSGSTFKPAFIDGYAIPVDTAKPTFVRGAFTALIPDSDIASSGDWLNEVSSSVNLYQSIDETLYPDDSDLIVNVLPQNNEYYECGLTDPIGPIPSGIMAIKWRGRNATSGSIVARVQLRQGSSTVIATRERTLPSTPTTFIEELTTGEKAAITDPTDLRLRFIVVR